MGITSLIDNRCPVCKRSDVRYINEQHTMERADVHAIAEEIGVPVQYVKRHFLEEHHLSLMRADYYKKSTAKVGAISMKANLVRLQSVFETLINSPEMPVGQVIALSKEIRSIANDLTEFERKYGEEADQEKDNLQELVEVLLSFMVVNLPPQKITELSLILEARGAKALLPEAT